MDFFVFISEQWILVSILLMLVYAFAYTERARGGKPVSTTELVQLMNSEQAILLDVRDSAEFQSGHVHGARHIPWNKLEGRVSELEKFRDRMVIVADKMGQHAGAAGKILSKAGFTVRRLSGGMSEWRAQNLPLVQGKN